MRLSSVFFALILSILVSSCTTVTEGDLADLRSPNAIVKKEAIDRISRGPGFPLSLMGPLVSRDNEKKAVTIMVALLRNGMESKEATLSLLNALAELGQRTEVPAAALIEKLKHKDPQIRHSAVEVLGKTKSREALPALVELLEQETEKYPIIWAIGEIGDQETIPQLDHLLASEDKYLTYNAYRALAKIGTDEGNRVVRPAPAGRDEAFEAPQIPSVRRRIKNVPAREVGKPSDGADSVKVAATSMDKNDVKSPAGRDEALEAPQVRSADPGIKNVPAREVGKPSDGADSVKVAATSMDKNDVKSPAGRGEALEAPQVRSADPGIKNVPAREVGKPSGGADSVKVAATSIDKKDVKSQGAGTTKKQTGQVARVRNEEEEKKEERQKLQQGLATKADPEKGTALYSRGLALQKKGLLQEAKELYEAALEISPNLVAALNNVGVIYIKEKNYGAASKALEKALKITPNHVDSYYNLACLYALQKDVGRSLSYLKKTVAVDEAARRWAMIDEDLTNLHGHSEYEEIVRETKSP
ncbi:MAG: tetratricopeptide repeat protein [Thermodesulfobacteriota bacterium]|nr:tetratricopeptide repeat protein [Thermodesulfobacteriota bacterium]